MFVCVCPYVCACTCVCLTTDDNECDGDIGDKCRVHGICNGFVPPGGYTCQCHKGYNTTDSDFECTGNTLRSKLYALHCVICLA